MIRAVFFAVFALTALAQECRFTPLTPAQPPLKIEEGEQATQSQTFQTTAFALSPNNIPHFFDAAFRIRRIDPNGRVTTLAGNGTQSETVTLGPATAAGMPAVSRIAFSPSGVLHFVSVQRVFKIVNGEIQVAAGSGRPGFNGEAAAAGEINLGNVVNLAFLPSGQLLILDGFQRVRRLDSDGMVRTVAGSTRPSVAAGQVGDNGPATEAALSSPQQIVPLRDGSFWIKDLSGRHLRLVNTEGIIRTINLNFEASVTIALMPDGQPAGFASNRVYPLRPNGTFETGFNPFSPFTGTPRGVGSDGALFYDGSARPEQRNPLVRMRGATQTVIAAAPTVATLDGQAPPYAVWNPRTNSLLYPTTFDGKTGILEARPGQQPRFIAGGGTDITDPEGKTATDLSIFGISPFTLDGEGRLILADVNRRRILVVGTDGKVSVLKAQGEQVIYAPLGTFSTLQRLASDNAGNIYWFNDGATPTGQPFQATIAVWTRATQTVSTFPVTGLSFLLRLEDGTPAVIAGNGTAFRSLYRISPNGLGEVIAPYRFLPLTSVARLNEQPYFLAASRLFRNGPGAIQSLDLLALPSTTTFTPDFLVSTPAGLLVHLSTDRGFYRLDNIEACPWVTQPTVDTDGVVNAASGEFTNLIAPRQLITISGKGLGPKEGQGLVLDGFLRATGQPAPFPSLVLGNFSGAIPFSAVTGTTLPVVSSDDQKVTVQGVSTIPASGTYLLYFAWRGLTLIHPQTIRIEPATPGLFTRDGSRNGTVQARNEDGSIHSAENPATAGELVHLSGTGFGAITANLPMGEFFNAATPVALTNAVTVTIGGEEAAVEFAGGAPSTLSVSLISVRVPETLAAGDHVVTVHVATQRTEATQRAVLHVKARE